MNVSKIFIIVVGIIILILALIGIQLLVYEPSAPEYRLPDQEAEYPVTMPPIFDQKLKSDFESNGERIYYTGTNETGQRIRFSGGPHWLYMHGGSCVNCHGVDGKGGAPIMMGFEIPSDITYEALTSKEHHEEEHEEHPPYTDETIKIAIREGIDPAGETLDLTMPRWQMSNEDLEDLIEYLKIL